MCADDSVSVYVNGYPILSMYVFSDPVFYSVWNEDSALGFHVCVVCVVWGFVHVSGVPVFGFLEEDYGVFP